MDSGFLLPPYGFAILLWLVEVRVTASRPKYVSRLKFHNVNKKLVFPDFGMFVNPSPSQSGNMTVGFAQKYEFGTLRIVVSVLGFWFSVAALWFHNFALAC